MLYQKGEITMIGRALSCFALVSLSACGSGTGPAAITTGFAPVNADNRIVGVLDPDALSGGSVTTAPDGTVSAGFAYLTETRGDQVLARAALINPQRITDRPTTGTGAFSADFEIAQIADTTVSREITGVTGTLPITVNFDTLSLAGTGDGLTVAGEVAPGSTSFTGTANWNGVDAELRGRVNQTRIIGAFAGRSDTTAFSGGFTGDGETTP